MDRERDKQNSIMQEFETFVLELKVQFTNLLWNSGRNNSHRKMQW